MVFIDSIKIGLITFIEGLIIIKKLAKKNNYNISMEYELIGVGLANLASPFFGGYPVFPSLIRSVIFD